MSGDSCLCCGYIGEPKVYKIDHPDFYVCGECVRKVRLYDDQRANEMVFLAQQISLHLDRAEHPREEIDLNDVRALCNRIALYPALPAQAVPEGFVELSKVIMLINHIAADWRDTEMRQKQYAAEYLRDQIRDTFSAAPKPGGKK